MLKLFGKNKKEQEEKEEVTNDSEKYKREDVEDIKKPEQESREEEQPEDQKGDEKPPIAMVKFDNVNKIYKGDFMALTDINLEIQEGEFVSIVGASGAGKSTLLKLIYAEEMPTDGTVYFDGQALNKIKRRKLSRHRRRIGTVFQDFKLLPKKTAFENVAYALEVCGASKDEIMEDVPQILDIVGLGEKMEKFPYQLSGGEQQKVVLARALIHKPLVIVADEPTGNLDSESSLEILKLLLKINKLGTTVILATHNREIVNKAARRVIVLDNGKINCDDMKGKYKMC